MSDEEPKAPKKKGKLPIILILALVIGGGGFFMMKSKGGAHKEPAVKLGAIEPLTEFLVNLKGNGTYLQTELAFHMKDGFKKEELEKNMPAVRDVVLGILGDKSINELSTEASKDKLKKEIATAVNALLEELEPPAPDGEATKKKKKKKKVEADEEEPEHPEWDSQEGPVLKVYFTKFATQ